MIILVFLSNAERIGISDQIYMYMNIKIDKKPKQNKTHKKQAVDISVHKH